MEKIKVSLNKTKYSVDELLIESLSEQSDGLHITTSNKLLKFISIGSSIHFIRTFNNNEHAKCEAIVTVTNIIDEYNIVTSIPSSRGYVTMSTLDYSVSSDTESDTYYIDFSDDIKIFDEDLLTVSREYCLKKYTITITLPDGEEITINDFKNIYPGRISVEMSKSEYETLPELTANIRFSQNEFYAMDVDSNCTLWSKLESGNVTKALVDSSKISVPFLLGDKSDYVRLQEENAFNSLYNDEYKDNVIPQVIDMEKIRFIPLLSTSNSGSVKTVEEILFNLYFRKKYDGEWSSIEDDTNVWNQFNTEKNIDTRTLCNYKSDYLSLLNFTDDDVYYQKLKLKKSFIRLSFYTSKDVLSQKLIGYSTIYFDTNKMYTEYLSKKSASKIASQISVNSCYDTSKSSEGFYIYIFKQDAPLENEEKTIYMKVEFNHAKYGKTNPMAAYKTKKNSSNQYIGQPIKPSTYFENIYIPVTLTYINNVYGYYIDCSNRTIIESGSTVNFYLFEPKLHAEDE